MEAEHSRQQYSHAQGSDSDANFRKRKERSSHSGGFDSAEKRRRRSSEPDHERIQWKPVSKSGADSASDEEDDSYSETRRRDKNDRHKADARRARRRDRSRDDNNAGDVKKSTTTRDRKYRERSRSREHRHRSGHHKRSRSPILKKRRSVSKSPPPKRSRAPLPPQDESFRGELAPEERPPEKQKPNFKPTGLLAKEANTVEGTTTVLKYHEPPEARKPSAKDQWRMYVFKKQDLLDTIQLHTRSAWLVGRDQRVTDLFVEHPSISKQHAVIQFRHKTSVNEYGDKTNKVKPYLIDLESANGTKVNGKKVETSRYMELIDGDVVGFGDSEREYVTMLPKDK